jgi:hypothetical protein
VKFAQIEEVKKMVKKTSKRVLKQDDMLVKIQKSKDGFYTRMGQEIERLEKKTIFRKMKQTQKKNSS